MSEFTFSHEERVRLLSDLLESARFSSSHECLGSGFSGTSKAFQDFSSMRDHLFNSDLDLSKTEALWSTILYNFEAEVRPEAYNVSGSYRYVHESLIHGLTSIQTARVKMIRSNPKIAIFKSDLVEATQPFKWLDNLSPYFKAQYRSEVVFPAISDFRIDYTEFLEKEGGQLSRNTEFAFRCKLGLLLLELFTGNAKKGLGRFVPGWITAGLAKLSFWLWSRFG